ncbi:hypothetical protein DCAR_0414670 [Daucus carota subsp. sativus]|uniref:SWIM-type domain-containing protein n=1 Tax=Daucus carota subsp. sativus TaxID=79200 RepID=A0AAF1AWZ0_DAUCS|nr:PREDICTED: uncharacterized protein LOC108216941 [Daucus carota subsp. sativus]WOG95355.1 hypothetical protein DCAR_0414670 [Daucus carota subsp. sativus]
MEQSGFTGDMGLHRFCLLHVRRNLSSHFPGSHLKMLCWLAGNTSQLRKFEAAMNKIKEFNPDAEKWLRNIPLEMLTMSNDGGYRYGQATTNMIESFNGLLRSACFLSVTSMIDYIYYRSLKLVVERRTEKLNDLQNGHTCCKKSRELFEKILEKASTHNVVPYNEQRGVFEVITACYRTTNGYWKCGNKHTLNLFHGFCSCGNWGRYHSPCTHIVAACLVCNLDWKQYIEGYYNLTILYEMWKYKFYPMANQAYWTFPLAYNWELYGTVNADENLRKRMKKRGQRDQSQRIRTEMDNSQMIKTCWRCDQKGPTRRSRRCPQHGK